MTEQFLLTRAVYHPRLWPIEANRRRLDLFEAITVAGIRAQTDRRFEWVVALSPDDELTDERIGAVESAGVACRFVYVEDSNGPRATAAVKAYRADWTRALGGPPRGIRLTTRLDDDDTFAPDAFSRIRRAAASLEDEFDAGDRVALMLPRGFRVWGGRYTRVRHASNAMATLMTGPGDRAHVYSYMHREVAGFARVVVVDERPAWLWTRHDDTLSGWRRSTRPITGALRRLFPIDWSVIATRPEVDPVEGGERFQ